MKLKTKTAISAGKFTSKFLKMMKRQASSLPGKVALKIDKDILDSLSRNTKFICVTGTNGKTMTTAFITSIMKNHYSKVITNDSGANMIQGIVTSLLYNKTDVQGVAVMEVDEANLRMVTEYIHPDYIVLTNLFEDQLDRFKSVENTFDIILDGIRKSSKSTIVANGNLPIFAKDKLKEFKPVYYGVNYESETDNNYLCPECGLPLKYKSVSYENLGLFECEHCNLRSPKLSYVINKITDIKPKESSFILEDYKVNLNVGGIYNIYNACSAYAVSKLIGVETENIIKGLESQKNLEGRQELVKVEDKDVVLNLVKNPAGMNQIINLLDIDDKPFTLYFLINNNFADGKDLSWLESSDFEKLKQIKNIDNIKVSGVKGINFYNLLKENGFNNIQLIDSAEKLKNMISTENTQKINVLANYTALNDFRAALGL